MNAAPVGGGPYIGLVNPVAVIDCGTNSIRLLIAKPVGNGLCDVVREMRIVRLGQDTDSTGRLSDAAVTRALHALSEYKEMIEEAGANPVRFVGTSAMRDATNGQAFQEAVTKLLGVRPEVIEGTEEAALSFAGAIGSLNAPSPRLVVDIGGGSTEFVLGEDSVRAAVSIDMGSVRVTERYGNEIDRAASWIDEQLDKAFTVVDVTSLGALVGVAGTVTTLAAFELGAKEYDPDLTHGKLLTWQQWDDAINYMKMEPVEVKAALPFMPKGRADVIGAGALIWERILLAVHERSPDLTGAYVSERDILDGAAGALLGV